MAPVLQCPDCGTKHPLGIAGGAAAFRCSGCGRVLKVPERFRAAAPGPRPGPQPVTTRVPAAPPPAAPNGRTAVAGPSRRVQRASQGVVPFTVRLLIWVVAVPVGFFVVFAPARAVGLLTSKQLEDVFLETGWGRFWPVVRLLPLVALVTAAAVHFSVLGISRWRRRRALVRLATPSAVQPGPAARRDAPRPVS